MSEVNFHRRLFKPKARKIIREFFDGATPKELAEKYGMSHRQVGKICFHAPAVFDIGDAPEKCRLGIYADFKTIIDPILKAYGVTWNCAMGHSRTARVVKCRWECWTALNDKGKPYIRIAEFFGRDHTTILNGCKQHRKDVAPFYWSSKEGWHERRGKEKDGSLPAAERGQAGSGESSRAA
jgi:hypothetical protein